MISKVLVRKLFIVFLIIISFFFFIKLILFLEKIFFLSDTLINSTVPLEQITSVRLLFVLFYCIKFFYFDQSKQILELSKQFLELSNNDTSTASGYLIYFLAFLVIHVFVPILFFYRVVRDLFNCYVFSTISLIIIIAFLVCACLLTENQKNTLLFYIKKYLKSPL